MNTWSLRASEWISGSGGSPSGNSGLWSRVGREQEVSTGVRIAASHYPDAPERSATAGEGGPASQTTRHAAVVANGDMSAIDAACVGDTRRIPEAYTPG